MHRTPPPPISIQTYICMKKDPTSSNFKSNILVHGQNRKLEQFLADMDRTLNLNNFKQTHKVCGKNLTDNNFNLDILFTLREQMSIHGLYKPFQQYPDNVNVKSGGIMVSTLACRSLAYWENKCQSMDFTNLSNNILTMLMSRVVA